MFGKNSVRAAYELGKFAGDSAGYPRVGIVNCDLQLIQDTRLFLEEELKLRRVRLGFICKRLTPKLRLAKQQAERQIGRTFEVVRCNSMFGEYAFRVSAVNGVLYKILEKKAKHPTFLSRAQQIAFVAGLADAEAHIDTRNKCVSSALAAPADYLPHAAGPYSNRCFQESHFAGLSASSSLKWI